MSVLVKFPNINAMHGVSCCLAIVVVLRPGNSQATTVKDSPQSTFPTISLTVWYGESVRFYGPATVGQSNNKGLPIAAQSTGIFIFDLNMKCKHLTNYAGW